MPRSAAPADTSTLGAGCQVCGGPAVDGQPLTRCSGGCGARCHAMCMARQKGGTKKRSQAELISPTALKFRPVSNFRRELTPRGKKATRPYSPTPDADELFVVGALLDCKGSGRSLRYLVRWEGYAESEDSWEPAAGLHPALIAEYERRLKGEREAEAARLVADTAAAAAAAAAAAGPAGQKGWQCERCARLVGASVFARREDDGFYWRGTVQARSAEGELLVEWQAAEGAASSPRSPGRRPRGRAWVLEQHVALAEVPCDASSARPGKALLAIWRDGEGYAAEVVGSAGRQLVTVQFEDGRRWDAPAASLRSMVGWPAAATTARAGARAAKPRGGAVPPTAQQAGSSRSVARQRVSEAVEGARKYVEASKRSQPSAGTERVGAAAGAAASDGHAARGPLHRTVSRLSAAWQATQKARDAPQARGGGPRWAVEPGPVEGLWLCRDFISAEETACLRDLFAAHDGWTMYNWGNVGRKSELASVLSRIDFGQQEMTAEGVAAARSTVQQLTQLQDEVMGLLSRRLREAFRPTIPTLWPKLPNMLQFSRIAPDTCLGNHFDRRDKWAEGIASIGWSEAAGRDDPRGDPWELCMQLGPTGKLKATERLSVPAGTAYVLSGVAQGRTEVCKRSCVAHESCTCCWTRALSAGARMTP